MGKNLSKNIVKLKTDREIDINIRDEFLNFVQFLDLGKKKMDKDWR